MNRVNNITRTEGLQTTQILIPGFKMINEHSEDAYEILNKELTQDQQSDFDRCYYLATDKEGRKYACTGTIDLEMYVEVISDETYDVIFNDYSKSDAEGFKASIEYCKNYINTYNGSNHSYFENYKGGTASIVCNETGNTIEEWFIKAYKPCIPAKARGASK